MAAKRQDLYPAGSLTPSTLVARARRGELIRDCKSLDGSSTLQCFVSGLDVAQDCADTRNYLTELAPALMAAGKGVDGQDGSLCTAVLATASPSSHRGARP